MTCATLMLRACITMPPGPKAHEGPRLHGQIAAITSIRQELDSHHNNAAAGRPFQSAALVRDQDAVRNERGTWGANMRQKSRKSGAQSAGCELFVLSGH